MAYILQFDKTDTLQVQLLSGGTSATLTNGNFVAPTGTQLLVVDYDVPAKAEVISATISNTSLTSLVRGLDGTSDVDHAANANVIMAFVPSHYTQLGALASSDAASTWAAVATGSGGSAGTYAQTLKTANYLQVGKLTFIQLYLTITNVGSWSGNVRVNLPVTAAGAGAGGDRALAGWIAANNTNPATASRALPIIADGIQGYISFSNAAGVNILQWSSISANDVITVSGIFFAA